MQGLASMAPLLLKKFTLALDAEAFVDHFWYRTTFYEKFLVEKLKDLGVQISEWDPPISRVSTDGEGTIGNIHNNSLSAQMISSSSGAMTPAVTSNKRHRTVVSFHPAKISFPGLPSHAESIKKHSIEIVAQPSMTKVNIHEVNSFRGIPYSDYFNVITHWQVYSVKNANSMALAKECEVAIYLEFEFLKYTWLQGTIESNTKAELTEVFELWFETASHYLRLQMDNSHSNQSNHIAIHSSLSQQTDIAPSITAKKSGIKASHPSGVLSRQGNDSDYNSSHDEHLNKELEEHSSDDESREDDDEERHMLENIDLTEEGDEDDDLEEDDDLLFYDCEEGAMMPTNRSRKVARNGTGSGSNSVISLTEMMDYYNDQDNDNVSGQHQMDDKKKYSSSKVSSFSSQHYRQTSTHELAVQIVETVFVFVEFAFWQIYQFYVYDLKDLFNIDPSRVWFRAINTFIPGLHLPIIAHPDLYGPLLLVLLLPQTLLLSTETSKHGCESTSQLGNAVIVSLFIWVGLSILYKMLAVFVAPTITFKHSLSMIGYSFFAWNVALICALPLEQYRDGPSNNAFAASTNISTTLLPLVIFGIPASIAQGYMFWEQTPPSTMILQPSSLPTSMQAFATTHSRMIQRFIWALPKIVAFILVAATHYQLLWYIARVFLPGRRQLCRLAALVRPSTYAEILSQKELRKFALDLLSGNRKKL